MKRFLLLLLYSFTVIGLFSATTTAQTCGDINNDGKESLGDLVYYISWLVGMGSQPPVLWTADIDNLTGYTIGDIVRLADQLFLDPTITFDCSPNDTYDYNISNSDTVFLPTVFADPNVVDQIELPILTSFSDSVTGLYLSLLNEGNENSGHYNLASISSPSSGQAPMIINHMGTDTSFFLTHRLSTNVISGENTFFAMTYDSTGVAGLGYIDVDPVDRSSQWRSCIAKKDGQLYIPVFATLEHTYNRLQLNESSIIFHLPLGVDSSAVPVARTIESNHDVITWMAETDASWIVLDKSAGQTPDQVQISVDKTGLSYGWYNGSVVIKNSAYPRTFPRTIRVSLYIGAVNYAGLDANCDGNFNVGDVTYLINHLFGGPLEPAPCEPCPAAAENYPPMDMNCDGKTNITDVVRAMRYLYEEPFGAIPCNRCTE